MNGNFARLGLWALPVAGILTFFPWFVFLSAPSPSSDLDGYARQVTSGPYVAGGYVYLVGTLCLLFGLLALYTELPRVPGSLPTVGVVLSVTSVGLLLSAFGVLVIAGPVLADLYQAGNKGVGAAMVALAGGSLAGRIIAYFVVVILLAGLGAIATGTSQWRSRALPRWTIVALQVGFILTVMSTPGVTHVGTILLIVTGVWIARHFAQPVARRGMAGAPAAS
jgi:hypothetical protein